MNCCTVLCIDRETWLKVLLSQMAFTSCHLVAHLEWQGAQMCDCAQVLRHWRCTDWLRSFRGTLRAVRLCMEEGPTSQKVAATLTCSAPTTAWVWQASWGEACHLLPGVRVPVPMWHVCPWEPTSTATAAWGASPRMMPRWLLHWPFLLDLFFLEQGKLSLHLLLPASIVHFIQSEPLSSSRLWWS